MLACIPFTMSRKRRDPPSELPLTKKSRPDSLSHNKGDVQAKRNHQLLNPCDTWPNQPRPRREASVRAQIAVSTIFSSELPYWHFPEKSFKEEEEEVNQVMDPLPNTLVNGCGKVVENGTAHLSICKDQERGDTDTMSVSLSPLSSTDGDWYEERGENSQLNESHKVKLPVLSLVPVECPKVCTTAKKHIQPNFSLSDDYVRRAANLKARACIFAQAESTKRYPKFTPPIATPCVSQATVTPVDGSTVGPCRPDFHSSEQAPSVSSGSWNGSRRSSSCSERDEFGNASQGSSTSPQKFVLAIASPTTLQRYGLIESDGLESDLVNTEGLLWNGDTIHPHSRVYLSAKGSLPHLIASPVRPTKPSSVCKVIDVAKNYHQRKRKTSKPVKGDNGWTALGSPIKTIMFPNEDGTKVLRRYYIGMKRRNEELYVRDCITVKSGRRKKDRPFIAKIGSIWKEEKRGLMVTLFWYYRPEEATGIQLKDPQEDELLASQHYDDNSVACIEDRCFVLGVRQYCRYRALCKQTVQSVRSLNTFATVDGQNEMVQLGLDHLLNQHVPENNSVFLCYRGYNHLAGRLIRSYKQ